MACAYRVRQFVMRLTAPFRALDDSQARQALSPDAWSLFAGMSRGDQAHALCVLKELQAPAAVDEALTEAALLHDVGKAGAGLTLVHRSVIVLAGALSHDLVAKLAGQGSPGWRYPFYAHLHHSEIGALRCRDAGCPESVVELVRCHESPPEHAPAYLREHLRALQRADDRC